MSRKLPAPLEVALLDEGEGVRIAPREEVEDMNAALGWLNWASLETDAGDDAVVFNVSVNEPRGCFRFVVRRLADGRLLLHSPYPGESAPHVDTREVCEGTLVCVNEAGGQEPFNFGAEESDNEG